MNFYVLIKSDVEFKSLIFLKSRSLGKTKSFYRNRLFCYNQLMSVTNGCFLPKQAIPGTTTVGL